MKYFTIYIYRRDLCYLHVSDGPTSSRLLQTQLPVRTEQECKTAFQSFKTTVIDNRVLCAGYARGGKDACQVREHILSSNFNNIHYVIIYVI